MRFRCDYCGEVFEEPSMKVYWENLDGENGWQRCYDSYCPFCGCETFEPVEEEFDEIFEPEPDLVKARREWEEMHG